MITLYYDAWYEALAYSTPDGDIFYYGQYGWRKSAYRASQYLLKKKAVGSRFTRLGDI